MRICFTGWFIVALLAQGITADTMACWAANVKKTSTEARAASGEISVFSAKFGGKGKSAMGQAVGSVARKTADGGYVVIGSDSKANDASRSIYIIKTNSMGKITWERRIGFDSKDAGSGQGFDIQQTDDGGYIATGFRSPEHIYRTWLWVLRMDGNGNTLWEKFFDGGADKGMGVRLYGYAVVQDPDGGFLLGGQIDGKGAYLLKLDRKGSMVWERLFPGARFFINFGDRSAYPEIRAVHLVRDGTGYLMGYHTPETFRVMRIDASGVESQTVDIAKFDKALSNPEIGSMIVTADGGFAVFGSQKTYVGQRSNVYAFILKFDRSGTRQWGTVFTRPLTFAGGLTQLAAGGYALCATAATATAGVRFHRFGILVVLLDGNGKISGSKLYGLMNMDHKCSSLEATSDGGFVIAGTYNGDAEAGSYSSIWLLKVDASGENPSEPQTPQKKAPTSQVSAPLTLTSQSPVQTTTTGDGTTARGNIVNLALNKPTRQSSVYGGTGVDQGPHFGVDGIRESVPRDPYLLVHTNADNPPWWQVDLQNVYVLTELKLYNRIFCCGEKNRTIQVYLSGSGNNWEKAYQHDGSNFKVLTVNLQGRNARFVKLQLAESTYLHFQECEVYGYSDPIR